MNEASWSGRKVLVLAPTPTDPLDFGNRKRIHAVCAALHALGAEIHYVHYASEMEWRRELPVVSARKMAQQWDSCWTVAPSRPLHSAPAGSHHTADEWWDPAIGEMLKWLFSVQSFDAFIVNYTWLTKAFEFSPRSTLKILDTHDRFSGRKELLAENGIAPEFFYMEEQEERQALSRADLVWAIKDQEATFFRGLMDQRVMTLPYSEAIQPLARRVSAEGIVRFGIVGARNHINLVNIRNFLACLRPYIERTLLPCEIHIAGSCCADLTRDRLPPYVHLRGRMPDLIDFYRSVDVVLAPMTFSTGLKIKVGEALSLGKALIAHEHAYEGYPKTHAFQHVASLDAMLDACRAVVRDPQLIGDLESASAAAAAATARLVSETLDRTAAMVSEVRPGVVVVIAIEDVTADSLRLDHASEVARYLGHLTLVHILLTGSGLVPIDQEALRRLAGAATTLIVEAALAPSREAIAETVRGNRVHQFSLAELCQARHLGVWFASPPRPDLTMPKRSDIPAYLHVSAVMAYGLDEPWQAFLRRIQASFSKVCGLSSQDGPLASAARLLPGVETLRVPCIVRGHHSHALRALKRAEPRGITLLADSADDPLVALTLDILRLTGRDGARVVIPDREAQAECMGVPVLGQENFIRDVRRSRLRPAIVINTSATPCLEFLQEMLDRHGVPILDLFLPHGPDSKNGSEGILQSASRLMAAIRLDFPPSLCRPARISDNSSIRDPGWKLIWQRSMARKKSAPRDIA